MGIYNILTEEQKEKMKDKSNPFYGKHHSKATKEKIGNSNRNPSKATRGKISKAIKELWKIPEYRENVCERMSGENHPNYGKPRSEETRKKISDGNRNPSLETRERMSKAKKEVWKRPGFRESRSGVNHPNYGKSLPIKTRKNISESLKGKSPSKITREKISKTSKEMWKRPGYKEKQSKRMSGKNNPMYGVHGPNLGKIFSKEHRKNISKGLTGIKRSKETREKLSKNHRGLLIGKKNPNYQGGKSFEPYTLDFNKRFKESIKERDFHCCQLCNIGEEDLLLLKRYLMIHHINYNKLLSIPQNCITLCNKCNAIVNFNRKQWTEFFQSLLKERYNYKYTQDQKIILDYKEVIK